MYARGEYAAIKQNEERRGRREGGGEVGIARQREQISRGGERDGEREMGCGKRKKE